MTDINNVVLVGRLTQDAELRYTATGVALCQFAIAVNRSVKRNEQWTDEASFFDLTLLGKMAQSLHPYLTKGAQVAVQGHLRQEQWEKDYQKFSKICVTAESVQLLGGKNKEEASSKPPAQEPVKTNTSHSTGAYGAGHYEDDIPF